MDLNFPKWRNTEAYIEALNHKNIKNSIINFFCKEKFPVESQIIHEDNEEEEAKHYLPLLMKNLRIFNISDYKYWNYSFTGVLIFLIIEAIIFFKNFQYFQKAYHVYIIIGCLLIFIIVCLLVFNYKTLKQTGDKNAKFKSPYTILAVITSIGLIILNFYLISKSQWSESPFMPAFLFVSATIISAPRENSFFIILLTIITFLVVLWTFYAPTGINEITEFSDIKYINISTIFCSIFLIIVLRKVGTKKILKDQKT